MSKLHLTALFLALFLSLAAGCASAPSSKQRTLASVTRVEQQLYQEGVAQLEEIFAKAQVTHPKHKPFLLMHNEPTAVSVVLMHGLNESPWYIKSVAAYLYGRGYNVVVPLLAKHWEEPASNMHKADMLEWIRDFNTVAEISHKLGRKVILAGHSTGGVLAMHAAVNHPQLCDGLVLWSPAIALANKTYYGAFGGWLASNLWDVDWNKLASKPPVHPENVSFYSPVAGREVYKIGYYLEEQFIKRVGFFGRKHWNPRTSAYAAVTVPVFLVMPEEDKVVHKPEVDSFAKSVSSPIVYLEMPGEQHNSLPKAEGDYFAPIQRANKNYGGMIEKLGAFFDTHFPSR